MAKSNADSKLRNIDAVKQMMAGTHKFQTKTTVSFADIKKPEVDRKVGDTWTDEEGNTWEQRQGYKIKKGVFDQLRAELNSFPNCRKEVCTCTSPGRADYKMRAYHGMCLDCVVDMEHELKLEGKFEEYAKNKLKQNALAWLRDSEQEVEELKFAVQKAPEFVTVDGNVNKWELEYDPEHMAASINDQFQKVKEQVFSQFQITEEEFVNFKTKKV